MTNKLTGYLIAGFFLVIFVGTFHLITQPLIALGETKSVTIGETIAATRLYGALFEGLISNDNDTIVVFSKYVAEVKTYMYIPVGSTFSIYGMTFQVVSVVIPKNVTVIRRIG